MFEKLISLLAVSITILTSVLYLSGYGYLFGYYQFFDIGIWELELSFQDIISHSASAILSILQNYFLLVAVVALAVFLAFLSNGRINEVRQLVVAFASTILIAILAIALFSSVKSGRAHASSELRLLNRFHLTEPISEKLEHFFSDNDGLQLLHLATTKTTFFTVGIFLDGRDRWIIRIPRDGSDVSLVYQDP